MASDRLFHSRFRHDEVREQFEAGLVQELRDRWARHEWTIVWLVLLAFAGLAILTLGRDAIILTPLALAIAGTPVSWLCADLFATRTADSPDPLAEPNPAFAFGRAFGRLAPYILIQVLWADMIAGGASVVLGTAMVWSVPVGPIPALPVGPILIMPFAAWTLLMAAWSLFLGVQTRRPRRLLVTASSWLFGSLVSVLCQAPVLLPPHGREPLATDPRLLLNFVLLTLASAGLVIGAWMMACRRFASCPRGRL
jgi:hypothetical protein